MHVTVAPPGVLDVRTDASGAAKAPPLAANEETGPRGGFGWFVNGEGVNEAPDHTEIADRQHIAIGLIPLMNDMGAAEAQAATKGVAMRDVHVGDGFAPSDLLWDVVGAVLFPCTFGLSHLGMNAVLPPWTTTMSGKRVATGAEVAPPTPVEATTGGAP